MFYILQYFFVHTTCQTNHYTLSLHDALPIFDPQAGSGRRGPAAGHAVPPARSDLGGGRHAGDRAWIDGRHARAPGERARDRKSKRLNSSHLVISYAVLFLIKIT